jgi:hypothetical protein
MFRDDHEAALERVASLEARIAELEPRVVETDGLRAEVQRLRAALAEASERAREAAGNARDKRAARDAAEVAEKERRKRETRDAAKAADAPPGRWRLSLASGWVWSGFGALFMGGVLLWSILWAPLHCSGRYRSADLVGAGSGRALLLVAEVDTGEGSTDYRLTLVRPSDGARLAVATEGSGLDFVAVRGERLWMRSNDSDLGLHVRDLNTLARIATAEDLMLRAPELSSGFDADGACPTAPASDDLDLRVRAKDGRAYEIHSTTLRVRPAEETSTAGCPSPSVRAYSASAGGNELALEGGPRRTLAVKGRGAVGHDTFLDGTFVGAGDSGTAIVSDDLPGALVLHKTTTNDDAHALVSLVSVEGDIVWTFDLGEETTLEAAFSADHLFVAVTGEAAMGVELATGKIRWRAPL